MQRTSVRRLQIFKIEFCIVKFEESSAARSGKFTEFISLYKIFSEQLANCIKKISNVDLLQDDITAVVENLDAVANTVDG